jgi:hypothetical protein
MSAVLPQTLWVFRSQALPFSQRKGLNVFLGVTVLQRNRLIRLPLERFYQAANSTTVWKYLTLTGTIWAHF